MPSIDAVFATSVGVSQSWFSSQSRIPKERLDLKIEVGSFIAGMVARLGFGSISGDTYHAVSVKPPMPEHRLRQKKVGKPGVACNQLGCRALAIVLENKVLGIGFDAVIAVVAKGAAKDSDFCQLVFVKKCTAKLVCRCTTLRKELPQWVVMAALAQAVYMLQSTRNSGFPMATSYPDDCDALLFVALGSSPYGEDVKAAQRVLRQGCMVGPSEFDERVCRLVNLLSK